MWTKHTCEMMSCFSGLWRENASPVLDHCCFWSLKVFRVSCKRHEMCRPGFWAGRQGYTSLSQKPLAADPAETGLPRLSFFPGWWRGQLQHEAREAERALESLAKVKWQCLQRHSACLQIHPVHTIHCKNQSRTSVKIKVMKEERSQPVSMWKGESKLGK